MTGAWPLQGGSFDRVAASPGKIRRGGRRHHLAYRIPIHLGLALLFLPSACRSAEPAGSVRQEMSDPDDLIPGDPIGIFPQSSWAANGKYRYSVPIVVPPGRAGMEPPLSLEYSSDRHNGMMGYVGRSIGGLSSITRCHEFLTRDLMVDRVNYHPADQVCLDGQKLVRLSDPDAEALPSDLAAPPSHQVFGAFAPEDGSSHVRLLAFSQLVNGVPQIRRWVAIHPGRLYRWYGETGLAPAAS
ncbi:MAG TPA: SpvB/TcaC N-terminal domain-containing protein [Kofleriaceae bacterium]|nr:SpvB/TcaC N-terminal domain-containing protein [Kofleriaceae bacterium]